MRFNQFKHKQLTGYKLDDKVKRVNREVNLSKKRLIKPLDDFSLFYEEIIRTVPARNRVRRIRQTSSIS